MTHVISDGHSYHGGLHVSEKKTSIKSPIMPYNKWEPPSSSTISGGGSSSKSVVKDTSPITPRRVLVNQNSSRNPYDYQHEAFGNHVMTLDSQVKTLFQDRKPHNIDFIYIFIHIVGKTLVGV
jgi:hypothetical protein